MGGLGFGFVGVVDSGLVVLGGGFVDLVILGVWIARVWGLLGSVVRLCCDFGFGVYFL